MKTNLTLRMLALPALLLSTIISQPSTSFAQGTAFTYQGRLNDGVNPANGTYDLVFTIYDLPSGPGAFANQTNSAMAISNGLFTVLLDFGSGVFTGPDRWLEIAVRTNGGGDFVTLSPRQKLTPTPYAITTGNLTGTVSATGLSGSYSSAVALNNAANSFSGSGAGLTALNANNLGSGTVPSAALSNAWKTTGNSGTTAGTHFIGTTDNQPLELKANGTRALRIEPNTDGAPNVIGGAPVNFVDPGIVGATIGGGGTISTNFYLGGGSNRVSAIFGTIAGGRMHTVAADHAFIGGGIGNSIQAFAFDSVIGGGVANAIQSSASEVVIGGGTFNSVQPFASYSVLGGGNSNSVQFNASYSFLGGGSGNVIQAQGGYSFLGGGSLNSIQYGAYLSTLAGGDHNSIQTNAPFSAVGGGYSNSVAGNHGTVPGGDRNTAGPNAFAAGRRAKATNTGAFVWADSQDADFTSTATNQFSVRANGGVRFVTGGAGMALDGQTVPTTNAALRSGGNTFAGQQTVIGGNVGIGTTSPQTQLHVMGPNFSQLRLQSSTGSVYWNIYTEDNFPTSLGNLLFSATSGAFIYFDTAGFVHGASDERLKRDIAPLGGVLDRVLQLRPVSYHMRIASNDAPLTLGLIAQEVEPLFPEVVGEHAGMKSLAYSELVPVTIRAIQELNQKLETDLVEQRQASRAKSAEIEALKQRVEKLEQSLNLKRTEL